ncbi:MAG: hypothetical protein KGK07_05850 [Chloroflexota bacterium]|nr:hypothetical protein [Chloroflexota bacterium]
MKRIALALFAIAGVVAAGFFATSAYFTDTINQNNYTFTTGSAALRFAPCPGLATDCSGVTASLHDYTFSTSQLTGPGKTDSSCLVIQNTGDYLLHLTSKLTVVSASPDGMQDAFQVSAAASATALCNPTAWLYAPQSARNAAAAGDVVIGSLAPGARMYVILGNAWDSTGNQNGLQNGTLKLNTSVTGKTD